MISVVLVNWNGKRFLAECLQSIAGQTYQPQEILIVDNASTDGSQEWLLREQPHYSYQLQMNTTNLGYCGGANLGIRQTHGKYVVVVNPDVMFEVTFLERLLAVAEQNENFGILTGKLLRFDRRTIDSTGQFLRRNLSPLERGYGEPDNGQYEQPGPVFSACGAVAWYRRTMLEDIQLHGEYFDESYFAFYEDLDIGWRAQLLGWKAYYTPTAVAYHYRGGGLSGQERKKHWFERLPYFPSASFLEKPVFIQRHIMLNRYLTLGKNASWPEILWGFPAIFHYELRVWGYACCVRPTLLHTLRDFRRLFPEIRKKRQEVQQRKVVAAAYIRRYIR